jgi:hypothetical protein
MGSNHNAIKCRVCGIEARVDLDDGAMKSFGIPQDEIMRRCKHKSSPICPNIQAELDRLRDSMLPSGRNK